MIWLPNISDMKQAIQELHSAVIDKDRHLRNLRLRKRKKYLPNFNIGTYVMVAAHEANKGKRQHKTQNQQWQQQIARTRAQINGKPYNRKTKT